MTILTVESNDDQKLILFLQLVEKLGLSAKTEDNKTITADDIIKAIDEA